MKHQQPEYMAREMARRSEDLAYIELMVRKEIIASLSSGPLTFGQLVHDMDGSVGLILTVLAQMKDAREIQADWSPRLNCIVYRLNLELCWRLDHA